MKYNNECNINVVTIGEKIEDYLLENKGRFLEDSDEGVVIELGYTGSSSYLYNVDFNGNSRIGIDKALFNIREQMYIETTKDKIQFTLGCKVIEGR